MYRKPWFQIIEVQDLPHGRSVADIVADVVRETGVPLDALRGERQARRIVQARHRAYERIALERPDVSSEAVGRFFRAGDGSTIRRCWRKQAA